MSPAPPAESTEETAGSAPDGAAGRPRGRSGAALAVVLALAGFLATARSVDRYVAPLLPGLTRKLDRFAANGNPYTVAFVGTSLVEHGFAPAPFAEEMERLGHPARAFNFGASHLCLGEALRIEDYILALHPEGLEAIVFDLEIYPDLHDGNRDSARDVWWHTPAATYDSLARDFAEPVRPSVRFDDVTGDVKTFARHLIAAGRVSDVFRAAWDPRSVKSWDELDRDDDGFAPYDALHNRNLARRHNAFLGQQWGFRGKVLARKGQRPSARHLSAYERAQFDTLVRRAREAGYRPILVDMPNLDGAVRLDPDEPGADPRAQLWTVPRLSFNDPGAYPDLFEIESRFDADHLSGRGAMLFTRYFARAYAEVVHGDRAPTPDAAPSKAEPSDDLH